IARAAEAIRHGQLVAFGTETVYGLGGDATNDTAVARIFDAKNRPQFNPLISHVDSPEAAFGLGRMTPLAETLAAAFWPGPLTLVLDRHDGCPVSPLALADLESIALRVPANPVARSFLKEAAVPVAAPSANRSGHISPTRADHVTADLGGYPHLALILDTGPASGGLESTVIDARGETPIVLRPGSITAAMISEATGKVAEAPGEAIISPGQMKSHYAPSKPLILNASEAGPDTAWIGFGNSPAPAAHCVFNLSPGGDLVEAAARLYELLREADASDAAAIAMAAIPDEGIGQAINDRLMRAAHRD
ncbi:MAG: L-threonylcarbamoyladenylate synthase, partial [Candidatus Puniceispirillales bacterium]